MYNISLFRYAQWKRKKQKQTKNNSGNIKIQLQVTVPKFSVGNRTLVTCQIMARLVSDVIPTFDLLINGYPKTIQL
jgi:hypothetical protein